ncbi:MAG: HD domain-containing protein [Chloroflexi bacterium]|nr:HD domain-containing protein [Chloroflexota bacterium]
MEIRPPETVLEILARLWASGHSGYVVGGSLRDVILGREPADWDLATDARPEQVLELFPGAVYENRFGTVGVRRDGITFEITTFRSDHDYADHRRPHRVEFGDAIEVDLARRDFTINALAWGADAPVVGGGRVAPVVGGGPVAPVVGGGPDAPALRDPYGGIADIEARIIRAVGDPRRRFEEDALRMVRAVRLATTLDFSVEAATLAAMQSRSSLIAHLSAERLAAELDKLLAADRPSIGLRLLAATEILAVFSPELAAQRGVPQNKIPGEDLWDHTVRTVDAVPADRPVVRLAALLHDIGKPSTMADGHFHGHDAVGADLALAFLVQLKFPRAVTDRVTHLVRNHMFTYGEGWSDSGVRRFIRRIGREALTPLFDLREADNEGSGMARSSHGLDELRRRIDDLLARPVVLEREDLAIDGSDLIAELGLEPGPVLGRILDELLEQAITDPAINDRPTLMLMAQSMLTEDR